MPITIEIEKHPLKDFAPSEYCEWCVTIKTSNLKGFKPGYQWALDFPPDTDILDPKQARKIKGAPKYSVDPNLGEGTITKGGEKELKICFVAACKERRNTDMSLERRAVVDLVVGLFIDPDTLWDKVKWVDAPTGVGKVIGPGSVASIQTPPSGQLGLLATFEALKTGMLLGIVPPASALASDTSPSKKIHVMALDAWDRSGEAPSQTSDEDL